MCVSDCRLWKRFRSLGLKWSIWKSWHTQPAIRSNTKTNIHTYDKIHIGYIRQTNGVYIYMFKVEALQNALDEAQMDNKRLAQSLEPLLQENRNAQEMLNTLSQRWETLHVHVIVYHDVTLQKQAFIAKVIWYICIFLHCLFSIPCLHHQGGGAKRSKGRDSPTDRTCRFFKEAAQKKERLDATGNFKETLWLARTFRASSSVMFYSLSWKKHLMRHQWNHMTFHKPISSFERRRLSWRSLCLVRNLIWTAEQLRRAHWKLRCVTFGLRGLLVQFSIKDF